ncbi:MAG: hypothetical protein B7733_17595 [Myxococcales bacterium FL481]|nr:MAG: hypothetical protein B7733_17595 [Myxococcales bacterium FL481]
MRLLLSSPAIMLAALAVSSPALAAQYDAAAHNQAEEPPAEDEGDDELELEDEMEAAPAAPDAEGDVSFDASFLGSGDKEKAEADADAATKAAAGDSPGLSAEEQQAVDEKMITVVQRQAFLNVFKKADENDPREKKTVRRLELSPQVGISVNDPYVRHYSAGAEANLWLTNRLALGIHAHGFFGDRTAAYNRIRFQEQTLLTANEYLWQGSLGVTYEPFYGKIAIFNRRLMHWEANVGLAGGVIHSRVLPRFEELHLPFDAIRPQGNLTVGSRFYVSGWEWVSFNFAVRTFAWFDLYEPFGRGPGTSGVGDATADDESLNDPDAAKAEAQSEGGSLAFNTMVYLGVSLYLPPRFNYSTRR